MRVLDVLRRRGTASRAELARATGLSRSTVSTIVGAMQRDGLIAERDGNAPPHSARGGRPPVILSFDRSAGALAGVDIGHDRIRVALADLAYTVLAEHELEAGADGDAHEALDAVAEALERLIETSGTDRDRILCAGVALSGPLDRHAGFVRADAIGPSWVGLDPATELERRLDIRVLLDNDANVGVLGEACFGAARGARLAAYVRLSTGVGVGLMFEGDVFRGADGMAGEIGHVLVDPDGPMCRCGNRGCLETLVAGPALCEQLARSHGQLSVDELLELAGEGDRGCQRVLHDAGRVLGRALAGLCNTINPDVVVIGGELSDAGDVLLDPLRAAVRQHAIPAAFAGVRVVPGELGARAELLGALALAGHESTGLVAGGPGGPATRREAT